MRTKLLLAALSLSAALAACDRHDEAPPPATPRTTEEPAGSVNMPSRKAGLWEQRVSMGGSDFVQASRICLDATVDKRLSLFGQQTSRDTCEKNLVTKQVDGAWRFSSVCDMGSGGKVTTSGEARGDFQSKYLVTAESSTVGAAAPQMNGVRNVNIEAQWMGPCPADFKPGDMEVAKGVKVSILTMGPMAGQAQ